MPHINTVDFRFWAYSTILHLSNPLKDYNLTYSLRSDLKYDKLFNLEDLIPNLEKYKLTYSIMNDTLSSNLFLLQNNSELCYRKNSGYNLAQVSLFETITLRVRPEPSSLLRPENQFSLPEYSSDGMRNSR